MHMYDIIEKKKNGAVLSTDEINFVIQGYTDGTIPDYQMSALLMAICLQNMTVEETFALTKAMIESGETIDLSGIEGVKVDKHSTGGVGDTTSLVLGPLVASLGVPFAKMSGRGLGHTGGTLDKLESIPGLCIDMSKEQFIDNTNAIKIAICGQTGEVTPADKKIYALRDATATVNHKGLIASSIMSKKIAVGADALVLDVKVGSGAFMKTLEAATELSQLMVVLGEQFKRKTVAVITDMSEPLGRAVGNSVEVIEAIDTLQNKGPKDLKELVVVLAEKLLLLAGAYDNPEDARQGIEGALSDGSALSKFKEMVELQGGDGSYLDDTSKFELSPAFELKSDAAGYVQKIDALKVGEVAKNLGAGRETKESILDLGAGIYLHKKIGDRVEIGDVLATLYTKKDDVDTAKADLLQAYTIGTEKQDGSALILKVVDHVE
ncbi:pyrimidine-nucleoside phosphorylase [Peptoniphilus equinus]|uniref:Pyrimidine-nucleoside phosphorylase n=1 Tax=Peptoniphilus equinus TaxID=3016343 RepID=A0ABY7QUZ0_9FIRM|nr:pyrimidine-nucleoside phosphorylase [Peptoniphilus equinus]WBW50600.1 pyrimidine-nucleoside phosphorylase [Peptoniphilus equinus]